MPNTSRKFIAHRVFDLVKEDLLGQYSEQKIWIAIAETDDTSLYDFYIRLRTKYGEVVKEIQKELNNV